MALRRPERSRHSWSEQLEARHLLSTITVTSLSDDEVSDGEVTLREAIRAANSDTSVDGSAMGSGADRIVFAEELTGGTIQLGFGAFEITESLIIRGPGARVTIDAGKSSGIFRVTEDVERAVLTKLRLVNAIESAVVNESPDLRVSGTQFINNSGTDGGAISSRRGAHTEVHGSLFERNSATQGGAIHAFNGVDVSGSKFRLNSASDVGGAIRSSGRHFGPMTITGSRFHRNTAGRLGGALHLTPVGDIQLADSVLSGNVADSGAALYGADALYGTTSVSGTTILGNIARSGGGSAVEFYLPVACGDDVASSSARVENSVVSGNRGHGIRVGACYSSLSVRSSVITGNNGSGVVGDEDVSVLSSVISGNMGSGIEAQYLILHDSTVTGNTGVGVTAYDASVSSSSVLRNHGGGISFGYTGVIRNTTVAENEQFGIRAEEDGPDSLLTHITVVGNMTAADTPAISGSLPLSNSIVADNVTTAGQRLDIDPRVNVSHSLISSNAGTGLAEARPGSPDASGNFVGTATAPVDPLLGAVFDNGGPTPTAALSHQSPAVDSGSASTVVKDQNDRDRDDMPDMGAFEFDAALHRSPAFVVKPTSSNEASEVLVFEVLATSLPSPGETVTATMDVRPITARVSADLPAFTPVPITLTASSSTRSTVIVPLAPDDHLGEPDRTLELFASGIAGENNGHTPGAGTILDDDAFQVRAVATPVAEGNFGTTSLQVKFEIVSGQLEPFAVTARTQDGTAKLADADFQAVDRVLSFAGTEGEIQSLQVSVVGDARPELDEYFLVDVAWPFDSLIQADIVNDDSGSAIRNGDLLVVSATGNDAIRIHGAGARTTVDVNGIVRSYDPVGFDDIVVQTGAGADDVSIEGFTARQSVLVLSGDGSDTVRIDGTSRNIVSGGPGNDTISGGGGDDTLNGQDGDDSIIGMAGNDVISGGNGSDQLIGEAGNDRARGDAGADTIHGADGNDTLQGGGGRDSVSGGRGHDRLFGGGQQDVLRGGDGFDRIFGGSGNDLINAGADADSVFAGSGADLVYGGDGRDSLFGEQGFDSLFGDAGNDSLVGDPFRTIGENFMDGGDGDDRLSRSTFAKGGEGDDTLFGTDGADRLFGDGGDDLVLGNDGNDTLRGGDGNDQLDGGDGDDLIRGEGSDDTLRGSIGDDTLYGNSGRDQLLGEDGDDLLIGGRHGDGLFGGDGVDTQNGGGGDDLLHAGLAPIDESDEIWRIWRSSGSYVARVTAVLDALGSADRLIERTDQDVDTLIDTAGRGFYMALPNVDIFAVDDNERLFELMP